VADGHPLFSFSFLYTIFGFASTTISYIWRKVNSADVGFEKQIWNAADVLRGSMDASEYKHVVLGLVFLKYISENIFFVPQQAR